jgi:hypothetical protein
MCSSQPPENGADSDPALWVHETNSLIPAAVWEEAVTVVFRQERPVWKRRAVNGGWDVPKGHEDTPQEEVSNAGDR